MDSTTLLLVVLLIAVLAAIGLLAVLVLRRPEERIGGLLRDEQRAGRGELREQLDGFALQQGQRIDGFGGQLQAVAARTDQRLDDFTLRAEFFFFKQRFKRLNQFFLFCRTTHKSPNYGGKNNIIMHSNEFLCK